MVDKLPEIGIVCRFPERSFASPRLLSTDEIDSLRVDAFATSGEMKKIIGGTMTGRTPSDRQNESAPPRRVYKTEEIPIEFIEVLRRQQKAAQEAALEVFTEEKYPLDPRIAAAREAEKRGYSLHPEIKRFVDLATDVAENYEPSEYLKHLVPRK